MQDQDIVLSEITSDELLSCPFCNTKLLHVLCTTANDIQKTLKVRYKIIQCYTCGKDGYFSKIYNGVVNAMPATDDLDMEEIDTVVQKDQVIDVITRVFKGR